ncbi:OB-fold domain-containing protein [Frankia sp. R82]|uniref:thiolase C-terminal domain-containing protein n=1 Tax=Frankia sp. R82 TaxID=2950553 RepID=UPI002042C5E0|nr:OB-fold domain-containing protein [Frankia sp. R82]MCM3886197.1 OB-fold domain-containing protein [Frankia sp. R82]
MPSSDRTAAVEAAPIVTTGWQRPLPALVPQVAPFWTGGADGELRLPRCTTCARFRHPGESVCPDCPGAELAYAAVGPTGVVVGVSVNHQMWLPGITPPYVVIVVELDDAPGVRLTSNLLVDDPSEIAQLARVGLAVTVAFDEQRFDPQRLDGPGDVWVPVFRPSGEPDRAGLVHEARPAARPPVSDERFERRSVLSGVGISAVGRRLGRPPVSLAVEASLAAIADAGLTRDDIDGISTYPGGLGGGMSEGGIAPLEEALGVRPTWFHGGLDQPGQSGAIVAAMLAVASGLCRHVLCVRTVWEATYTDYQRRGLVGGGGGRLEGDIQWRLPYGAASAGTWIGLAASQYLHRYKADREVLGRIAVNARAGAARNPNAVYRDPLTLDDYFAARMISTPFGLYDCDVPCDGSVAVIVSAAETAGDAPNGVVRINAVGTQITERPSWDQGTLTHEPMVLGPATHLWTRTDLTPADVDVALLYDGFSFNCLSWIEALGFCGFGEASDFIGDGTTIGLGGSLPLNPHGGQLSAGRLHGFGFLHEAITQLRGVAGERQVADAQVAVVSTGGGAPGGTFLLTRDT